MMAAPGRTCFRGRVVLISAFDVVWDGARWPNFTAHELACRCGRYCQAEYWHDPGFLDALQALRSRWGRPLVVNSGHRCDLHNAAVGGAPLSAHKKMAVDLSTRGLNTAERGQLLGLARAEGFTGFGFYSTWLHLDRGRPRYWFSGKGGRARWQSLI